MSLIPFVNKSVVLASTIFQVELDATVSEMHVSEAEVTDLPVEAGTTISDHMRLRPKEIQVEGIITNAPVEFFASFRELSDRAERAYQRLLDFQTKAERLEITTTLRSYKNMILTRVAVPRDKQRGNAVFVQLALREIRTTNVSVTDVPTPKVKQAVKKVSKGKVPVTPATDAAKAAPKQSMAHFGVHGKKP
jgi:hypothetical protein